MLEQKDEPKPDSAKLNRTQTPASLLEYAPAKINLTLRVLGRRPDGFHALESLVVFARARDALVLTGADALALETRGPTAGKAGATADNLVLKAAAALSDAIGGLRLGHFTLIKRLPVAAGLGGGSSDAAAALRLLARVNDLALDDPRLLAAAAASGSDVPVCLSARVRVMRGRGEELSAPLQLPKLAGILVNCGVAVATRDVFAAWARQGGQAKGCSASAVLEQTSRAPDRETLLDAIAHSGNDLEAPAIALCPAIADVLDALRALPGSRLARMSGSGATCFALFDTDEEAAAGARTLRRQHPDWWVRATALG